MKKKVLVGLAALTMIALASAGTVYAVSSSDEAKLARAETLLETLPVQEGALTYKNLDTDYYGNQYTVYQDNDYEYRMEAETQGISMISLQQDLYEKVFERSHSLRNEPDKKSFQEDCVKQVQAIYPNWNWDIVEITASWKNDQSVSHLDLSFKELLGDDIINSGGADFAKDGTIILCYGSNNVPEDFNVPSISKEELRQIIASHIENQFSGTEPDAAELPETDDSLKIKEEMTEEELAPYLDPEVHPETEHPNIDESTRKVEAPNELLVSDPDKLQFTRMNRVKYNGQIVWDAEVLVETTYGLEDEIQNPYYSYYIDSETGEIVEVVST